MSCECADPALKECGECRAYDREGRQLRLQARLDSSGLPPRLRKISLVPGDQATAAAMRWASGSINGLCLVGGTGTGKTMLAAAATWKRLQRSPVLWVKDEEAEGGKRTVFLLRHYIVFNVAQCDGLDVPGGAEADPMEPEPFAPIEAAEEVVAAMADPPSIGHGGDRAFYRPPTDHVQMPPRESFVSPDAYYGTLFHELAHSTGHERRLGREGIMEQHCFGSQEYSREELIAEFGAAFVAGSIGLDPDIPQSAAYIDSWRRKLGKDKKLILTAAARGQKAADRILGVTFS